MKSKIKDLGSFYHGVNEDIDKIKHLCGICIKKNINFYKRQPCMQIIMNKPKERYVIDLTYLHFDFKNLLDKKNIVFIYGKLMKFLIEKDYSNYNLYRNDICLVKSNLLKKVDYNVWL